MPVFKQWLISKLVLFYTFYSFLSPGRQKFRCPWLCGMWAWFSAEVNIDEASVLDSSGFSIDTVVTAWQGGCYDGLFAFSQVNTLWHIISRVAIIVFKGASLGAHLCLLQHLGRLPIAFKWAIELFINSMLKVLQLCLIQVCNPCGRICFSQLLPPRRLASSKGFILSTFLDFYWKQHQSKCICSSPPG